MDITIFNYQETNNYSVSFCTPDASDIGSHTQLELDRGAITNINDANGSFGFQSNKFENESDINVDSPSAYLIGDVDGDDVFQLNDTCFLWEYTSGVFSTSYTHITENTYQQWSSIDNLKSNGNQKLLITIKHLEVVIQNKREFSVFWDNNLDQETDVLTQDRWWCDLVKSINGRSSNRTRYFKC